MNNWTIFTGFTEQVDAPLQGAVSGIVDTLFPSVMAVFRVGLMIWIALLGYRLVWGRGGFPLQDAVMSIIYAAVVSSAMTLAVYNQYVTALFLHDLPNAASSIVGGNFDVSSFDTLWGKAYVAGLKTWQGAGFSLSVIPIGFMIVVFWFVTLVCIGIGYIVWLASHVIAYLAVAVGPIFFVMYLFPPVKGYFERWIGVLVSSIVLQLLVAIFLSVILTAETSLMSTISVGGDPFASMQMLLVATILFVFCALLLKEMPNVAIALAGGVHFYAARYTSAMTSLGARSLGSIGQVGNVGSLQTTQAIRNLRASSGVPGKSLSVAQGAKAMNDEPFIPVELSTRNRVGSVAGAAGRGAWKATVNTTSDAVSLFARPLRKFLLLLLVFSVVMAVVLTRDHHYAFAAVTVLQVVLVYAIRQWLGGFLCRSYRG